MRECPTCGRLFNAEAELCPDDGASLAPMGEADPLVGTSIGHYRITRRLGRGGMGSVYVGEHPSIGSTVAVKVLHRKYAADPAVVDRFFNEARAVNLIGHENIVRIFDFGHLADGTPYFVMELLSGRSLSALCGAPQPADELARIFTGLTRGLGAAHAAGVIHRDLKPDNVFLENTGDGPRVKILDFGIAKLASLPGVRHTESGAVLGSARYLSPEQAAGDNPRVGPRSDIYSLGVMLFELACGRVPFEGTTYGDLLLAHRTQAPPRPREITPDVPVWLEQVILRCLRKDPDERYASMEELAHALAARAIAPVPPARRPRVAWVALAGSAALLLVAGLLVRRPPVLVSTAARSETLAPPLPHAEPASAAPVQEPAPLTVKPVADAVPPIAPPEPQARRVDARPHARVTASVGEKIRATPAASQGPRFEIPAEVGDGMIDVEL